MDDGADAAGRVPERFRGLDRFVARDAIVAALDELGLLVRVEPHEHAVRHCYRCGTVVEPRLSDQWFVRMAPLAAPALAALRDSTLRILPERWEAVYVNWLENIRDWNVSRQVRTRMCSTPGSHPGCGHSRPSAGPTTRRTSGRSIRHP